jgi:hypothetical protein
MPRGVPAKSPEKASAVLALFGVDFLDDSEAAELVQRLRAKNLVLDVYEKGQ